MCLRPRGWKTPEKMRVSHIYMFRHRLVSWAVGFFLVSFIFLHSIGKDSWASEVFCAVHWQKVKNNKSNLETSLFLLQEPEISKKKQKSPTDPRRVSTLSMNLSQILWIKKFNCGLELRNFFLYLRLTLCRSQSPFKVTAKPVSYKQTTKNNKKNGIYEFSMLYQALVRKQICLLWRHLLTFPPVISPSTRPTSQEGSPC